MELKQRIQARMDEKDWKLADLARESGVAKGYLWEILAGTAKRPSAETLYAVAQALGTTVADLLGRATEPGPGTEGKIPMSLQKFAQEVALPDHDIRMLAAIHFRNDQPKTKEDWRFLWESIRRSVRG